MSLSHSGLSVCRFRVYSHRLSRLIYRPFFRGQRCKERLSLAIQTAVAHEIINELGYGDGAATTAARGAAAEAAMNVDEGTGEDDAAWATGEGDGLGGREGA